MIPEKPRRKYNCPELKDIILKKVDDKLEILDDQNNLASKMSFVQGTNLQSSQISFEIII